MKYIDADRLKAKIDEHYRKYQSKYMETRTPYTQGLIDGLDLAEQVIDSLHQERPEVDLEREIIKYKVPFSDEREYLNEDTLDAIAKHFYELGLKAK